MSTIKFSKQYGGIGLFHLGIETYRWEIENHYPWASVVDESGRTWTIHLGFWRVDWS